MPNDDQNPNREKQSGNGDDQRQPRVISRPPPPVNDPARHRLRFCEKYRHEIVAAAVIAAVIYAVFTWMEWKTFDSERVTMEKDFAAGQTNAIREMQFAQSQLSAMQKQLDEMNRATELDERAWVYPEIDDNSIAKADGDDHTLGLTVKNKGKTAALITGIVLRGAVDMDHVPKFDAEVEGVPFVLGPNNVLTVPQEVPQVVVNYSHFPVYFYGTVFYRDIFGNRHWTQFCYVLTDGGAKASQWFGHALTDDMQKANGN